MAFTLGIQFRETTRSGPLARIPLVGIDVYLVELSTAIVRDRFIAKKPHSMVILIEIQGRKRGLKKFTGGSLKWKDNR